MKFLFLDIETSNKFFNDGKICLIGSKIINDDFEVLENKEILINPTADFDEYILNNLPHQKNDFDEAKNFADTYDELKTLLESEEQVIIAKNGYNDIKLLKDECTASSVVPFGFIFYDFNEILLATKRLFSEEMLADMPKSEFTLDSVANVDLMIEIIKYICAKMKKSLRDLFITAVNSEGYWQDGFISFRKGREVLNPENTFNSNLNKNSNYKAFLRFLNNIKVETTDKEQIFEGKTFTVSTILETNYFKEMINLVKWLKEFGANYTIDVNNCNLFVKYDVIVKGKPKRCSRFNKIEQRKSNGEDIEVMTLDEILSKIGKTTEELFSAELPDIQYVYGENSKRPTNSAITYKKIRNNFHKG